MKSPFNTTPLEQFPYNSRTTKNEFSIIADSKNYVLHGFKPGNALQASELNEIQENFYKNLTLHNLLLKNWLFIGSGAFVPGNISVPISGPSWLGALPLDPFKSINVNGYTITFKKDWYLVDDRSGLKFWIYNNRDIEYDFNATPGDYIGLKIYSNYITSIEDSELNDNSSGFLNTSINPGADRYQLNFNGEVYQSSVRSETMATTISRDIFQISPSEELIYLNNLLHRNG